MGATRPGSASRPVLQRTSMTPPDAPPETPPGDLPPNPLAQGQPELSLDEAAARLAEAVRARPPVLAIETVDLLQADNRVLAGDLICPLDVPPHDNAAMDGFALSGADLRAEGPTRLHRIGTVLAGAAGPAEVARGQCVRIMTGAVMPAGLDTVVPLELCRVEGDGVVVDPGCVAPGDHRRRRGEDLRAGQPALHDGRRLRPSDLGLAASLGCTRLPVRRRLRVALFSTGDEVVAPGGALPPGAIYDSNRFSLGAALARLPVELIDLRKVPDDPVALSHALDSARERAADAVVTSGGVSAGDADHVRGVLARHGEVGFWKVAMRPGRPFAFGRLDGGALLFGLPGNPVAALVTFYALARDALLLAAGACPEPRPRLKARSREAIRKRPGRTEFQRALLRLEADGVCTVGTTGSQGAGVLRSMSEANALLVLGHGQGSVAAGEAVEVWPFEGLL